MGALQPVVAGLFFLLLALAFVRTARSTAGLRTGRRRNRTPAVLLVAMLVLVGCGGDDADDTGDDGGAASTEESDAFPVTIETAGGGVTVQARPERIVSLSPTATESLFALGAGDQVEAVDDESDFPEDAPRTDLSGFELNIEALVAYDPDLVILSTEEIDLQTALSALDVPVLVQVPATTFSEAYEQIEQLGTVTGHGPEASDLVAEMQADIDALAARVPAVDEPLTYYHELDDTFYTATSSTFIGQVYEVAGLVNIADEADDGSGFPQLSPEFIIDADPDLIFLADTECCNQSAATVGQRPGWDQIAAVQNDGVIELDDDVASRWGPRVVDYVSEVVDAMERVTGS